MTIGDNSIDPGKLRSLVERIERLNAGKDEITEDIREVYTEAKSNGYDPKIIRAVIRKRAQDAQELAEFEALVAAYEGALG
jgi:uncharacterized protein (UPF0335 family)